MKTSNIDNYVKVELDSNTRQIRIIIQPVCQWNKYSGKLYLYILFQAAFIVSSVIIARFAGIHNYTYGILFFVLYILIFIGNREFTQLILALQFISLVVLICVYIENISLWYLIFFICCFVDNLFIGSLKNKLFKEFICITLIEINKDSIFVKRKLGTWWQKNFSVENITTKIDNKMLKFYLNKMTHLNIYFFIYQLRILIASMAKPSVNRDHLLIKLESRQFQFGLWLSSRQKTKLINQVGNYLCS